MRNRPFSPTGAIRRVGLQVLILLGTGIATAKEPPAPAIWDGNDGLQPPMRLRYSDYLSTPGPPGPPFYIVWRIHEAWETPDGSRQVSISRARLQSRRWAVRFMECILNPGRLAFLDNHRKWDKKAVLGSHSLTTSASILGNNRIWFVLDKEFVDFEYSHPNKPPKALEWQQATIRVGRSIGARIRAQNESGEHEKNDDEDDEQGHSRDD